MKNPFTKTRKLGKIVLLQRSPEEPNKFWAEVIEWRVFGWTWWSVQTPLWSDGEWIVKHISLI
jgi:hypothetical protein